jgi:hypothetical protein
MLHSGGLRDQAVHFFFFFFFCSTGVWTQGLHLEPPHQPYFCEGFFEIGSGGPICWGWLWTTILLISAYWVARITDVSHQCPARLCISEKFPGAAAAASLAVRTTGLHSGPWTRDHRGETQAQQENIENFVLHQGLLAHLLRCLHFFFFSNEDFVTWQFLLVELVELDIYYQILE